VRDQQGTTGAITAINGGKKKGREKIVGSALEKMNIDWNARRPLVVGGFGRKDKEGNQQKWQIPVPSTGKEGKKLRLLQRQTSMGAIGTKATFMSGRKKGGRVISRKVVRVCRTDSTATKGRGGGEGIISKG